MDRAGAEVEMEEGTAREVEVIATAIVDAAFKLHRGLGPGLLESVYQKVLARMLEERGLRVERNKVVAFEFEGMRFDDGLRVDLLVEGVVIIELKSLEQFSPTHLKQLLTYLRLLHLRLGLLINFGAPTFKEGIRRVVNPQARFAASRLRVREAVHSIVSPQQPNVAREWLSAHPRPNPRVPPIPVPGQRPPTPRLPSPPSAAAGS